MSRGLIRRPDRYYNPPISRATYMVSRGNLPNYLIPRLNRRTTSSQRVVGYRPTYRFLPTG